ncbi:hypothetical protein TRICI_000645 [Trichomonascus ciferrii]|uniref:Uncharacterized protein n=1 Tax=Trichomonascus ciferrii TaxID=44093 RepID=A0A642VCZ6_9ASCO|nr:hypothetical protein TRICI_000645 [Trichomonascus ciferrii]
MRVHTRFSEYPLNASSLRSRLEHSIFQSRVNPPVSVFLDALDACKELVGGGTTAARAIPERSIELSQTDISNGNVKAEALAWRVVSHARRTLGVDQAYPVSKRYLTLRFEPKHQQLLELIALCKDASKQLELGYISLRYALLDRDLHLAFAILDAATKRPVSLQREQLLASTSLAVASILGAGLIDFPLSTFMLGISGSSIAAQYLALSRTDRVKWRKHVSVVHQLSHFHTLMMANRIIAGVDELMDVNVTNYHQKGHSISDHTEVLQCLRKELRHRNLKLISKPDEETELYHQYWKTAGKDIHWVEPDQDPTDRFL